VVAATDVEQPTGMPVIALFGPTGTGKTSLACGLADTLPLGLISCDSVQVYRDLSAATAKPEADERRHPWGLVDRVDPTHDLDLGQWVREAERLVTRAAEQGRWPTVVGGTGLYLRGLIKGVAKAPARDPLLRERLYALAGRHGVPWLHRVLTRLDPRTAARLRPGDRQRLVRALEVRLSSGESLAALQADGWCGPDRYPVLRIGLDLPRDVLYRRLDERVDRFFQRGLVEEVLWLLGERSVPPGANALRAIGYREVVARCAREASGAWRFAGEEAAVREEVKQATRRYAKRQMTWFRRERGTHWLDAARSDLAAAAREIIVRWKGGTEGRTLGYTPGS
jgi:tRNA dimethylallyltransferase